MLSNLREFLYCAFNYFGLFQKQVFFDSTISSKNKLFFVATLKHVARTVAHVELVDHVVEVVFTIFDENRTYTGILNVYMSHQAY